MFIILTLIVAVAAFNLVSTLVMAVTDKQPDIAILRTLGATPGSIMKIFMVQGSLIGVIGTVIGVVGGILIALNIDVVVPAIENACSTCSSWPTTVYYISELPSDLQWRDVITVAACRWCSACSRRCTRAGAPRASIPAEALRYE